MFSYYCTAILNWLDSLKFIDGKKLPQYSCRSHRKAARVGLVVEVITDIFVFAGRGRCLCAALRGALYSCVFNILQSEKDDG